MVPIYKPYMPENIITGINEILYSGQLGFGKYGRQFENQLKSFIGCEYLLSVSSYNTALQIVLSTLGLNFGDEILASPVSCLASNQPFAVKGLKVTWVDIDPKKGTICPEDLKSKITKNTKAIFHNHFCGYVGDIDAINQIGKESGIFVVDDCIEAFGSECKGNKLGNVGTDVSLFSFQTVRLPNTIDGGAIVFKDKNLYEKAKLIRDYGINRSLFRTSDGEINPDCDIKLAGYGGLMSELNSFIGIKQMEDIKELLTMQRNNAKVWTIKIANEESFKLLGINTDVNPNYWVFGLLCENKKQTIYNFKQNGYYATGVHINNNVYSVFNNKDSLKGVNEFMNHFVAIPCGWWVENK
jgi:dTDP-4-amino-4,6-dideoxygalactose transaminase